VRGIEGINAQVCSIVEIAATDSKLRRNHRSDRGHALIDTAKLSHNKSLAGALRPEVALLLSTYQKPRHLQLSLASIALQQGVAGMMELVVTDDGSTDETPSIVEQFARTVDFPVRFTTHRHRAFQLARCRNEGVAASVAPYILFLDGDCALPPDFVQQHLRRRRQGLVMTGDCYRLEPEVSARIDETVIRRGDYHQWVSHAEVRRLVRRDRKARWYNMLRHRSKPKLLGGNVGIWRSDFERVNGYDEDFEGWGCEDDDLGYRLRKAGLRIESIMRWTRAYHLWHPADTTAPARWREGANVPRLLRGNRPAFATNGLRKADQAEWTGLAETANENEPIILPFRRPEDRPSVNPERKKAA
jgi:glycosyltransferase involved in cell wall biosynthesis